MFIIFAESHKIIATKITRDILDIYGLKLDNKTLIWGSVLPDYHPKYKLIRHYKEESLDYITREIIKVIYINRNIDFLNPTRLEIKRLSRNIGIISHYISDYTCIPHANRWTFSDNMLKHIKYEYRLNEYAPNHDFKKNKIYTGDIELYNLDQDRLEKDVKTYIENVIEEYKIKQDYKNDLDFALSLNLKLSYFILDTIKSYSEEISTNLVLQG